jgi:hypothetical protein
MYLLQLMLSASAFARKVLAQNMQLQNMGSISYSSDLSQACLGQSWPPSELGKKLLPQLPDADLQNLLSQVDTTRIKKTILKLVSFGTRHTLSSQTDPKRGIGAARDWIAEEMRSYGGRLKVEVQSYVQRPVNRIPSAVKVSNILGRLEGSEGEKGRVYVISGHYDSIASDILDFESEAPGANDDASGVAGMYISLLW